ncbi:MAG: ATP-binding protein [Patescibacteria group bacterium]
MSKDEIKKGLLNSGNNTATPKNIIRHKFLIAVFLVATSILVMSIFGAIALQKVWNVSYSFATIDVPAFSDLYKLEELLTREGVSLNRLIPIGDKDKKNIEMGIKSIRDDNRNINNLFSNLETIIQKDEEKNSLKKAKERFALLEHKSAELYSNVANGQIYETNTDQLLLNMNSLVLQTKEELFTLSHLVGSRVSENSKALADTHSFTRRNLILIAIGGLFMAALLGLFIGKRNILDPVTNTEQHIEELAKLNDELNKSNKLLVQRDTSLSDVNEKLRQQDNVRSEFVSTVAHQLRTPLAGIKWTLDMLVNGDIGKLNVEQNTMLFKIADSNDRMIRFVNDLLSLSRMESGRLEYNFVPMNLQHVAESVLLDLYPVANKKQIIINFRGKGLNLPEVLADRDKIRAVFQNLIENSIKYSPQGGHVTIELRNRGTEIFVSVIDEGMGIPKDEQKKIFNRFYRAPSAAKIESEGSGLGLYLARNIIDGHGGKIWFESEVGKGTSFYFTIPVSKRSEV